MNEGILVAWLLCKKKNKVCVLHLREIQNNPRIDNLIVKYLEKAHKFLHKWCNSTTILHYSNTYDTSDMVEPWT